MHNVTNLVPRLSHRPVLDRLQYAKMEGEGLIHFITYCKQSKTGRWEGQGTRMHEVTSARI